MTGRMFGSPRTRTPGGGQVHAEDTNTVNGADLDAARKSFVTLQARLASRGYALHELSCGGYLVARHDGTAHLADLHGVACFLRGIGGSR